MTRSRYDVIDVAASIQSGQVFLWDMADKFWYGVDGQDVLRVDGTGRTRPLYGPRTDLFRRRDDMGKIIKSISSRDMAAREAAAKYPGLRILEQDPYQCMVSFITSANSSIQKIRSTLVKFCSKFGERAEYDSAEFSLFPRPERVAALSVSQLASCGFGYRAGYVLKASRMVARGSLDLAGLKGCGYHTAREELLAVPGIGGKVADCIMLFSLDKLEAFPLDRWMARVLGRHGWFGSRALTTPKQYQNLHDTVVRHYGPYAGYAQQFLFKSERDRAAGHGKPLKW